ncbi:2402_t:CDS:2 [Diversispora eburnea]|uniref:2402_t:CDS:1 n=1 Tax=Diversispora eburnea TaxID=1213867 RepID=A0A9N8VDX4_9GLOM|nr:2402_t:CDS:2 [Diversispora eburnea]
MTYEIICNLIFNSCNYLRGLTYHWKEEFNTIKLLDYTKFSRFHQVIYNLRIFKFDYCCFPTPVTRNLLSTISKFNNNIQYLLINTDYYVGSELMKIILQFIKSQKRIKVLSINVCLNLDVDPEILYQSIQFHSNTLTHLKLDAMNEFEQLLKLLVTCKNLITLEILGFDPEMIPYLDELPIIPQINIKNLYCLPIMNRNQKGNSSEIQLFSIIYLLKMTNFNLKSFTYLANCTPNLMNIIKYKCSNITHLTFLLSEEKNILDLCDLLMNLPNLEHLSLKISSSDLEISDKFIIQKLAISIPYTLNTLGIYFFLTTECLKILLTNCKSVIRVLTLPCKYYYITDEIFEILKNYYYEKVNDLDHDQDYCLKEFRYSLFSEGNNASISIKHNENIQKLKSFIPIVDVANSFSTPFYGDAFAQAYTKEITKLFNKFDSDLETDLFNRVSGMKKSTKKEIYNSCVNIISDTVKTFESNLVNVVKDSIFNQEPKFKGQCQNPHRVKQPPKGVNWTLSDCQKQDYICGNPPAICHFMESIVKPRNVKNINKNFITTFTKSSTFLNKISNLISSKVDDKSKAKAIINNFNNSLNNFQKNVFSKNFCTKKVCDHYDKNIKLLLLSFP